MYEIGKITQHCDFDFVVCQGEDLDYLIFHISNIFFEILKTKKEWGNLAIFGILGLWNGTSTDSKWRLASQTNILCHWLSCFVSCCREFPLTCLGPSCPSPPSPAVGSPGECKRLWCSGVGMTTQTKATIWWPCPSFLAWFPELDKNDNYVLRIPVLLTLRKLRGKCLGLPQPSVLVAWVTLTRHCVWHDKEKWSDVEQKGHISSPSSAPWTWMYVNVSVNVLAPIAL